MIEPVDQPHYWQHRISQCKGELHRVMFDGSIDIISKMEYHDRIILEKEIKPEDSVLDCGCGYGRLLYLLPNTWQGKYLGVDISPDLIRLAQALHPDHAFIHTDLRELDTALFVDEVYDVAVVSWVKGMVQKHLGEEEWQKMFSQIQKYTIRIIYLRE